MKQAEAKWKELCWAIYGTKCAVCNQPANSIHHFIPRSRNGLMIYDIKNGVPLCISCHYIIHFSHNPADVFRIVNNIRKIRGKKWCKYIDEKEKCHKASFKTVFWLKAELDKLQKYGTKKIFV